MMNQSVIFLRLCNTIPSFENYFQERFIKIQFNVVQCEHDNFEKNLWLLQIVLLQ